jgi:hypothetical protein
MAGLEQVIEQAAARFPAAADLALEDVQQHRLSYHLLRLTLAGLSRPDVRDLGALGRVVFDEGDVTTAAAAVEERADASSLARTIASIVGSAAGMPAVVDVRATMVGCVLGAYAYESGGNEAERSQLAIAGAVGGALAGAISKAEFESAETAGIDIYLEPLEA